MCGAVIKLFTLLKFQLVQVGVICHVIDLTLNAEMVYTIDWQWSTSISIQKGLFLCSNVKLCFDAIRSFHYLIRRNQQPLRYYSEWACSCSYISFEWLQSFKSLISRTECLENVFGTVLYKSITKSALKYSILSSDAPICGHPRTSNIVKCVTMVFIAGFGGCVTEHSDYSKIQLNEFLLLLLCSFCDELVNVIV